MKCWRASFALVIVVLSAHNANANDIKVSNVSSFLFESIPHIRFDLSWENSWRSSSPANYDAAWVFVKYKDNDGEWKHLQLNGSSNPIPGFTVEHTNDGLGVFIHRSVIGTGSVSITGIELGAYPLPGFYDIKVYAVEMVFIPESAFWVGDGNGSSFSQGSLMKTDNLFPVTIGNVLQGDITSQGGNDDEILNTLGIGIKGDGGLDTDDNGTIDNPSYPTGYKAFYCMKYELSQRGFSDFLNTLSFDQQDELGANPDGESAVGIGDLELIDAGEAASSTPAYYGVDGNDNGLSDESNDNEWSAAREIDWIHLAAWLDWAALRPMTDLEFEKICRGVATPINLEYVWGTPGIQVAPYTFVSDLKIDESVTNAGSDGNANYGGIGTRVLRCGIFANGTSTRKSSGAAYYGAMDMGGNIAESVVSLGNVAGRSFTGLLGDGQVNSEGKANVDYWPGNNNNDPSVPNGPATVFGVNTYAGIGVRGGNYSDGEALLRLSNRQHAALMALPSGGRGVRQQN